MSYFSKYCLSYSHTSPVEAPRYTRYKPSRRTAPDRDIKVELLLLLRPQPPLPSPKAIPLLLPFDQLVSPVLKPTSVCLTE
ncbi:hypothetical protein HMPREF1556_01097 [Porphyromonas sp. oral taxon 278 str. W7784]|nr:hypothetical protein HMPREF1556_01097 [Porphyromonas sp. oral taxon 278 str. W7784]